MKLYYSLEAWGGPIRGRGENLGDLGGAAAVAPACGGMCRSAAS